MKTYSLFCLFALLIGAWACTENNEKVDPTPTPTPPPTPTTATSQTYILTLNYNWNATDHGTLPSGGHFTTLFIVTHNNKYQLYARGQKASAGMESLAETGKTSAIQSETTSTANAPNIGGTKTSSGTSGGITTSTVEVTVSATHPYLSFATMIAPSPDWFIGKAGILLYENSTFKDNLSGTINTYDAGTEEGDRFSLNNNPTNPQENITLLTSMNGVPIDNTNKPLATYTIRKK